MQQPVVVTGIGLISPLGDSREQLHAALCEGRSGLSPVESFATDAIEWPIAGEIASFKPKSYLEKRNLRPLDRTSRLLTCAAQLAINDSGWTKELLAEHEVGLVVGTMYCSAHTISEFDRRGLVEGPSYVSPLDFANTVINAAAGQTAIWHKLRGVNSTISAGTTSSLQALAYAMDLIGSGRAERVLAGGVEELCYETMLGYSRAGLTAAPNGQPACPVPFDVRRNGFAVAEGAALLMLESADSAATRGANVLAVLDGHGAAFDFDAAAGGKSESSRLADAIRIALHQAEVEPADVDAISASASGSVSGDRLEAVGLREALNGRLAETPITAVKSMLGESLGASAALQTIALIESMRQSRVPGIHGLGQADEVLPAAAASSESRAGEFRRGLVTSVAADGPCCALVVSAAT